MLGIKSVDGSAEISISHVHRLVCLLQFILLRCAVSIVVACGEDDTTAFRYFNILFKNQRLLEVVIFCNVNCEIIGDKISVRLLRSSEAEHRVAIFCQQDAVVRNLFETLYALTCSRNVDILDAAEQNTRNTLHSKILAVLNYYILVLSVAEERRVFGRSNVLDSTDSTFISGTGIPLLITAADIFIAVTLNYKISYILQLSGLSQHLAHAGLLWLNEGLTKILVFDSLNGILCRTPVYFIALLDDKSIGIQILFLFLCKESSFLVEHRDDLNRLCLREHLRSLLCEGVDLIRAVILESGIQIVDVGEHVDELLGSLLAELQCRIHNGDTVHRRCLHERVDWFSAACRRCVLSVQLGELRRDKLALSADVLVLHPAHPCIRQRQHSLQRRNFHDLAGEYFSIAEHSRYVDEVIAEFVHNSAHSERVVVTLVKKLSSYKIVAEAGILVGDLGIRKDAELLFKGRPLARLIRCCFAQIAFVDDEIVRHTLHIPAGLMFAGL